MQNEIIGWRRFIFPIHSYELNKLIPLGLMIFCITFMMEFLGLVKGINMNMDLSMGIRTYEVGLLAQFDQTIVFLVGICFVFFYTILMNIFKREYLFYSVALFFLLLFSFGAYSYIPSRLIGISSQFWILISLPLFFWALANQMTSVFEAPRFYGLLILFGSVGNAFARILIVSFSNKFQIFDIMTIAVIGHLILISSFYYRHRYILSSARYEQEEKTDFEEIFTFPYFGVIFLLLLVSTLSLEFFQKIWKEQAHLVSLPTSEYVQFINGTYLSFIMPILLSVFSIHFFYRFSWKTCALMMPIGLLISFLLFFSFILLGNTIDIQFLKIAVMMGKYIKDFSQAMLFVFFAFTIEMAYLPINTDLKTKGQLFVGIIGKGICQYIVRMQPLIFYICNNGKPLYSFTYTLTPVLIGLMVIWIICVFKLNQKFQMLREYGNKEKKTHL